MNVPSAHNDDYALYTFTIYSLSNSREDQCNTWNFACGQSCCLECTLHSWVLCAVFFWVGGLGCVPFTQTWPSPKENSDPLPPPPQKKNLLSFWERKNLSCNVWQSMSYRLSPIGGDTMQLLRQQFPWSHVPVHVFRPHTFKLAFCENFTVQLFHGKFMRVFISVYTEHYCYTSTLHGVFCPHSVTLGAVTDYLLATLSLDFGNRFLGQHIHRMLPLFIWCHCLWSSGFQQSDGRATLIH